MTLKIVINESLKNQLNGFQQTVQFCTSEGRTVGQFVPQSEYERLKDMDIVNSVTVEELDDAMKDLSSGCSLAEMLVEVGAQ